MSAIKGQQASGDSSQRESPKLTEAEQRAQATIMPQIDLHQARGNMLAQMGRVLTKEEQDRARDEVLAYEF